MELYSLVTGGSVNVGNLWTDVLFAVCAVVLLAEWRLDLRVIALNILEAALLFAFESALSVVWDALFPSLAEYTFAPLFLSMAIYAAFQRQYTVTDRVARCTTFAAAFVLIVSLTGTLMPAFAVLKRLSWGMAVPSAISYVAMLAVALVVRRFSVGRFSFVPRHYVWLVVVMDVLGAFAGLSFILYTSGYQADRTDSYASIVLNRYEEAVSQVNLIVDVSFLFLIVIAYLMFYVLAREHDRRTELLITKKSDVDSLSIARMTKTMYEQLREMRHELKNHDAYLAALVDAKKYDQAREFLATHAQESHAVMSYVSCGNPIVDSVVNAKMTLARTQGIEVKTMLAVPPELPFDEGDVFRLLANLLDNAIEGASASGSDEPSVLLRVMPEAGYYFIRVENPCDPHLVRRDRLGKLVTTKTDGDVHGYGTRVIEKIAEKYQGHAAFSVEGEKFIANVMLARPLGEAVGSGEKGI